MEIVSITSLYTILDIAENLIFLVEHHAIKMNIISYYILPNSMEWNFCYYIYIYIYIYIYNSILNMKYTPTNFFFNKKLILIFASCPEYPTVEMSGYIQKMI